MNKTCNGCKAAQREYDPAARIVGCLLGYSNKDGKPETDCPKPKTWDAYNQLEQKMNQ